MKKLLPMMAAMITACTLESSAAGVAAQKNADEALVTAASSATANAEAAEVAEAGEVADVAKATEAAEATETATSGVSTTADAAETTELLTAEERERLRQMEAASDTTAPKFSMTPKEARKQAYKEKYGGYTPKSEFDIPTAATLVTFGLLAKIDKKNFRSARNNFIPSYKNGIDDYMQYGPVAISTILNVAGYEGRSNFPRYLLSAGASYAVMAALVNGVKYTAQEMRPDGSTANSFPSGHTATAFTAATILHKEYGLTRSPWWSVLGYAMATTTGIMRTLNNRHWISDVLVGAGIGVISTDVGYMIADLILKKKGIKRQPRLQQADLIKKPSFFKLSLGMQTFSNIKMPTEVTFNTMLHALGESGASLDDDYVTVVRSGNPFRIPDSYNGGERTYNNYSTGQPAFEEGAAPTIHTSLGTSVGAEAAYFFNPYVGAGIRARISTSSVYADGLYCYDENGALTGTAGARLSGSSSASDVLSVADIHIGIYGQLPITPRHAIGAKLLYGRRFFGSLDLQSVYDISYRYKSTGEENTYTLYGDDIALEKTNSDAFGAGISYTYAAGSGMALSAFVDYDYTRPEFSATYTPYNSNPTSMIMTRSEFKFKQAMHAFTIGASMVVSF